MINNPSLSMSNRQSTWAADLVRKQVILIALAVITITLFHSSTATAQVQGSGTAGAIPKWTAPNTLGDSVIKESNGNIGIGTNSPLSLLHLSGSNAGITFNTGGVSKGRIHTVTPNWIALTMNTNFSNGWVLDNPDSDGWFFKLDGRGFSTLNHGMWLFRIPPGAGAHVGDEYPVFGVIADKGAIGKLSIGYLPTSTLDIKSAGSTSSSSSLSVINSTGNTMFFVRDDGNIGIGTTTPSAKLHVEGDVTVTGNIAAKYQDVAEWVGARQPLVAGTVVVIDEQKTNHVVASSRRYDTRVAGVISEQPGLILGENGPGKVMVATTGRVRVKADATKAPIRVGDLLVTGENGTAIKSEPIAMGEARFHRPGTILGKALEPLKGRVGEILVLLSLQ